MYLGYQKFKIRPSVASSTRNRNRESGRPYERVCVCDFVLTYGALGATLIVAYSVVHLCLVAGANFTRAKVVAVPILERFLPSTSTWHRVETMLENAPSVGLARTCPPHALPLDSCPRGYVSHFPAQTVGKQLT